MDLHPDTMKAVLYVCSRVKLDPNDIEKRGQRAASVCQFGPNFRYEIAPIHTRFGAHQWMIWDHETIDPMTNLPAIIRQSNTYVEALIGS